MRLRIAVCPLEKTSFGRPEEETSKEQPEPPNHKAALSTNRSDGGSAPKPPPLAAAEAREGTAPRCAWPLSRKSPTPPSTLPQTNQNEPRTKTSTLAVDRSHSSRGQATRGHGSPTNAREPRQRRNYFRVAANAAFASCVLDRGLASLDHGYSGSGLFEAFSHHIEKTHREIAEHLCLDFAKIDISRVL